MAYIAPLDEVRFLLESVHAYTRLEQDFPDADFETAMLVLEQAGRLATEVAEPLRRPMDLEKPVLVGKDVVILPEIGEALAALADSGVYGISAPVDRGGLGFPLVVQMIANYFLGSANLALSLNPLLTQGAIEAIEQHAPEDLRAKLVPNLASGKWTGTMLLTEPDAGSDLGAIKTKAIPDLGHYRLEGTKIFITWGENPFASNMAHLVLARLSDAPPGVKGISLFYVPKYLEDGSRNAVCATRLEEKLGLHGSPTCVMNLDGAHGWLLGSENDGLKAMFTMMNNARLGVAFEGISVAQSAYQEALVYAKTRIQSRPITPKIGAIIDHADVTRMLVDMKRRVFIALNIALACAMAIDLGKRDPKMKIRADLLTPIAKAYGTQIGIENAQDAIQVFGGLGYIEETGIAQYARDVRVTSIYEGTNGIQAMDLVGRKMADQGDALFEMIEEMRPHVAHPVIDTLTLATRALVSRDMAQRGGDALGYLMAFADVLGGFYLTQAAKSDPRYAPFLSDHFGRALPLANAMLEAIAQAPRDLSGMEFF